MRMPRPSMGAAELLDTYHLYNLTQLRDESEVPGLTEPFREAQESLRERQEEHQRAQEMVFVGTVVRDRKEMALDQVMLRYD